MSLIVPESLHDGIGVPHLVSCVECGEVLACTDENCKADVHRHPECVEMARMRVRWTGTNILARVRRFIRHWYLYLRATVKSFSYGIEVGRHHAQESPGCFGTKWSHLEHKVSFDEVTGEVTHSSYCTVCLRPVK